MSFLQILVLAAVQGLTEFLPVSSSGHLILVPFFTGWPDQGLHFDIAVHFGTLLAVLCYFRRDVAMIIGDTIDWFLNRKVNLGIRVAVYLIVATIPAVIFGLIYKHFYPDGLRSPHFIAINLIVFGILMGIADQFGKTIHKVDHLNWRSVMMIGLAQALAIIPGVSRSGITITTARFLGLNRFESARFSMLLAIPTIGGAALLAGKDLMEYAGPVPINELAMGIGLSFVFGFLAIAFMMRLLQHTSLKIFSIYRIALGAVILLWFA
ncbi:MAG: undecaprenyl-diphosphate phosphatase [Alphaproteobacteria bacterium]|nr:MAG: undecaprenyl-diphosphate phosphatase [Alphaproteobacteria bacterium]